MENKDFLKIRSMTACMKASYDMMANAPRCLVKKTWKTHLPLAVLMAVVVYFLLPNKGLHDWGADNPWVSFIIQTCVYAMTIVMAVVAVICTLPYGSLRRPNEKRSWLKAVGRIMHHLGGFLFTTFLGGIVLSVVIAIAALPSLVIMCVQFLSQLGAIGGDPLGVPAYFMPLSFAVFFVSCLCTLYAADWLGFSLAYLYGSYKVQDEQRQSLKAQKETEYA